MFIGNSKKIICAATRWPKDDAIPHAGATKPLQDSRRLTKYEHEEGDPVHASIPLFISACLANCWQRVRVAFESLSGKYELRGQEFRCNQDVDIK